MRDLINKLLSGNKKEGDTEPLGQAAGKEAPAEAVKPDSANAAPVDAPEPPGAATDEFIDESIVDAVAETMVDTPPFVDVPEADDLAATQMDEPVDLLKTAPLPPLEGEESATTTTLIGRRVEPERHGKIEMAYACHIGAIRNRNEDSCLTFESHTGGQELLIPFGLYIVADGMGGHHAGHEASRRVSRLVGQHVLDRIYLPLLSANSPNSSQVPIHDVMVEAVQAANTAIHDPDPEKDGGTTLTAALVLGRRIYLSHVGDSRAYMFVDDALEQITVDHTLVQRLQDAGQLTAEEAERHPHRNVLYRAVGQGGDLDVDTYTRPVPKSGKLMLCSDGLWGLVPETVIQEILTQDISLEDMVELLVKMALHAGGHDNISVILIDFDTV